MAFSPVEFFAGCARDVVTWLESWEFVVKRDRLSKYPGRSLWTFQSKRLLPLFSTVSTTKSFVRRATL